MEVFNNGESFKVVSCRIKGQQSDQYFWLQRTVRGIVFSCFIVRVCYFMAVQAQKMSFGICLFCILVSLVLFEEYWNWKVIFLYCIFVMFFCLKQLSSLSFRTALVVQKVFCSICIGCLNQIEKVLLESFEINLVRF